MCSSSEIEQGKYGHARPSKTLDIGVHVRYGDDAHAMSPVNPLEFRRASPIVFSTNTAV